MVGSLLRGKLRAFVQKYVVAPMVLTELTLCCSEVFPSDSGRGTHHQEPRIADLTGVPPLDG